jgi:hypothetical protein
MNRNDDGTKIVMWPKRFLWAGVSSSVIAAAITLFCVLLLFYWLNLLYWVLYEPLMPPPNFTYSLISPFSASYLVYPACWYFLIFRPRNYSIAQTSILVSYIYPISCGLIGATGGIWTTFLFGLNPQAHFFDVLISIVIWTIAGFAIFLIPYILIAFPMARLQRFLLLWLFPSATRQKF